MPRQPILCFSHVILLINSPPMAVYHQLDDIHNFVSCLQSFNRTLSTLFSALFQSVLYDSIRVAIFFLTPYTIQGPHSSVCRPSPAQFRDDLSST